MPTRFVVGDFDLKDVGDDNLKTSDARKELRKRVRDRFTEVYRKLPNPKENEKAGHTKFFYTRLRFWSYVLFKIISLSYIHLDHQTLLFGSMEK